MEKYELDACLEGGDDVEGAGKKRVGGRLGEEKSKEEKKTRGRGKTRGGTETKEGKKTRKGGKLIGRVKTRGLVRQGGGGEGRRQDEKQRGQRKG